MEGYEASAGLFDFRQDKADDVWRDGQTEHCGLGRGNDLRMRSRLNIKKAGRYPLRERVGPAKNLLKKRKERRPARHKDTMVPCWRISLFLEQKSYFKLGGFTRSFAEITKCKELGSRSS